MRDTSPKLERVLSALRQERIASETPEEVVIYAQRATRRAFAGYAGEQVSEARVRRYFGAVERRRLVRRHGGSIAAARLVAQSVVADLEASGRDSQAVIAELERGWGSMLPSVVIEEHRHRLCA